VVRAGSKASRDCTLCSSWPRSTRAGEVAAGVSGPQPPRGSPALGSGLPPELNAVLVRAKPLALASTGGLFHEVVTAGSWQVSEG